MGYFAVLDVFQRGASCVSFGSQVSELRPGFGSQVSVETTRHGSQVSFFRQKFGSQVSKKRLRFGSQVSRKRHLTCAGDVGTQASRNRPPSSSAGPPTANGPTSVWQSGVGSLS